MFVDDAFMSAHFPPRIIFANRDEQRAYKSRLVIEAQLLRGTPRHELAVLLFQQIASIEMALADTVVADPDAPSRNDHLVSAASCLVHSGDLAGARALLLQADLSPEAKLFFARLPQLEEASVRSSLALRDAFFHGSLDGVRAAADVSWGLVPVRVIYWPLLRLASRASFTDEAKVALRRLIIAYPMELPFHLIYLSSSVASDRVEAIEHALLLTSAFPSELGAHVALATTLTRAGEYGRAVPVCVRTLQLVRERSDAAADPNSMVSMAFATASVVFRRSGRRVEGLQILSEGVDRLPQDPELRTLFALALLAEKNEQKAGVEAEIAATQVDRDTTSTKQLRSHWPHTIAGVLALRREDWQAAIAFLNTASTRSSGLARARNLNDLGVALARVGDVVDAEAAFAAAMKLAPGLEVAARNWARSRNENERLETATSQVDMEDDLFRFFGQQAFENYQQMAA